MEPHKTNKAVPEYRRVVNSIPDLFQVQWAESTQNIQESSPQLGMV